MNRPDSVRIPVRTKVLVQGGMLVLLGAYCFVTYALVRPLFGTFGFDGITTLKTLLAVLVLGAFMFWLAPMTDVPTIVHRHVRPARRYREGACPGCGYPEARKIPSGICPECGTAYAPPPEWRLGAGVVVNFLLLFLVAMLLGAVVAETRLLIDERQWEQDCRRPGGEMLQSRSRVWPSTFAELFNDPVSGPYAQPLVGSRRDPAARKSRVGTPPPTSRTPRAEPPLRTEGG